MHPYLFRIHLPWGATFRAPSYGFMILVGFLVCLWLSQRRARRLGLNPTAVFDCAVIGLLCGVIGARVFYVIDNWNDFWPNVIEFIRLDKGGLAFYGGFIGGAIGFAYTVRRNRLPWRDTLDVGASLVPLGHAFGRIGCFLNGCCFGKVTEAFVGLRFPRVLDEEGAIIGSPPFLEHLRQGLVAVSDTRSLPVHPTQLYEVAYNLVIFAVLTYAFSRRRRAGDVAWLYPIGYGAARFCNEFVRADTAEVAAFGGLTIFQVISVLMIAFGVTMSVLSRRRPAEPMSEPWEPPIEEHAASR